MKRPNPKTGQLWKFGDIRDDGYIFSSYVCSKLRKDGSCYEQWYSPENWAKFYRAALDGRHRFSRVGHYKHKSTVVKKTRQRLWTVEEVLLIRANYKNNYEWMNNDYASYRAAQRYGWLPIVREKFPKPIAMTKLERLAYDKKPS